MYAQFKLPQGIKRPQWILWSARSATNLGIFDRVLTAKVLSNIFIMILSSAPATGTTLQHLGTSSLKLRVYISLYKSLLRFPVRQLACSSLASSCLCSVRLQQSEHLVIAGHSCLVHVPTEAKRRHGVSFVLPRRLATAVGQVISQQQPESMRTRKKLANSLTSFQWLLQCIVSGACKNRGVHISQNIRATTCASFSSV